MESNCCVDIVEDCSEDGHLHSVTSEDVRNVVMHLNTGKQDDNLIHTSEHIIQGSNLLTCCLVLRL